MRYFLFIWLMVTLVIPSTFGICPIENNFPNLRPWSNPSSWPSGVVPADYASVVIDDGRNILLDRDVNLYNLHILRGSVVWASDRSIKMSTRHILIKDSGSMHIGSEECPRPFQHKAVIELTGNLDDIPNVTGFGQKFIGVGQGGTLELHGATNGPAWTKLSSNLGGRRCFDFYGRGLGIIQANRDSGAYVTDSYKSFDTYGDPNSPNNLINYINSIPDGNMFVIVAHDSAETYVRSNTQLQSALVNLGCTEIPTIKLRDGYVCIGKKGVSNAFLQSWSRYDNTIPESDPRNLAGTGMQSTVYQSGSLEVTLSGKSNFHWGAPAQMCVAAGGRTTLLNLAQAVSWPVGAKVVISSTDFDEAQTETATIAPCSDCNSNQIRIESTLKYPHYGSIDECVDMRAEVGLLTRPIYIHGKMQSTCGSHPLCNVIKWNDGSSKDLFGGQLKVLRGFSSVHIEGVELEHMGQQSVLGSYPLHFHMVGDVDNYASPPYLKKNTIHHSVSRCITVHGTNGLLVKDNIGYDVLGHCFFLEDGGEVRNVFDGNLGLVTRHGTLLPTDRSPEYCDKIAANTQEYCNALATFWITNPNNTFINNIAGGGAGDCVGFWFIFPEWATGPSAPAVRSDSNKIWYYSIGKFHNNIAHSNHRGLVGDDGIVWDSGRGPAFLGKTSMRWKPKVNPAAGDWGVSKTSTISMFTAYKNRFRGAWIRGGDIHVVDSTFADNGIGLTMATDGGGPNEPDSVGLVRNNLFVGWTNNLGSSSNAERSLPGWWGFNNRGFEIYDGPIHLLHNEFSNYFTPADALKESRTSSAIGYLMGNNWNSGTNSRSEELSFHNADRKFFIWGDLDGDKHAIVRDNDGSISGVPNAFITRDAEYFRTNNCFERSDWKMFVCKDEYAQVMIYCNAPGMLVKRNDNTSINHQLKGSGGSFFHIPVRIGHTMIAGWNNAQDLNNIRNAASPSTFTIQVANFLPQQTSTIGFCYPPGTIFQVNWRDWSQPNPQRTVYNAPSYNDLNNSGVNAWWFDNNNGVLFIKIVATSGHSTPWNYWSKNHHKEEIVVTTTNLNGNYIGHECLARAYPQYAVQRKGCDGSNNDVKVDSCGVCGGSQWNPSSCPKTYSRDFHVCHANFLQAKGISAQGNIASDEMTWEETSESNETGKWVGVTIGALVGVVIIVIVFAIVVKSLNTEKTVERP